MPLGDCGECLKLIQNVTRASSMHMVALSRLEAAVQKGADETEIASLIGAIEDRSVERQETVDRYRLHLRSHDEGRVMTAGG